MYSRAGAAWFFLARHSARNDRYLYYYTANHWATEGEGRGIITLEFKFPLKHKLFWMETRSRSCLYTLYLGRLTANLGIVRLPKQTRFSQAFFPNKSSKKLLWWWASSFFFRNSIAFGSYPTNSHSAGRSHYSLASTPDAQTISALSFAMISDKSRWI